MSHRTIRIQTLSDNHLALRGDHRKAQRTISLIKRDLFWPKMSKEIKDYVKNCFQCHRSKNFNLKIYGQLRPLPAQRKKWEVILMNFKFDLHDSKDEMSSILDEVDK